MPGLDQKFGPVSISTSAQIFRSGFLGSGPGPGLIGTDFWSGQLRISYPSIFMLYTPERLELRLAVETRCSNAPSPFTIMDPISNVYFLIMRTSYFWHKYLTDINQHISWIFSDFELYFLLLRVLNFPENWSTYSTEFRGTVAKRSPI